MSGVVNPRDLLLRGTPTRMVPIVLPPNIIIPGLDALKPDSAKPPPPTGLEAVGALYDVNIRTNPPAFLQGHGYSHTKIYGKIYTGGPLPMFADAAAIFSFIGQVGSFTVGPAVNMRIWATWVTRDGVESSPQGGLYGVLAATGDDAGRLVAALTGPGKPFTVVSEPTVLPDGTVVPVGTYTSAAYMQRFVANRGQIGLLAVDDARIASASATKLTTGTVRVGVHISSSNYVAGQQGWAINGQGGAEFNSVTVRGGIFATYGTIGGCTITGGGVYSPNYVDSVSGWGFDVNGNAQFNQILIRGAIMGGAFRGYGWPTGAGTGFYLGPQGLLLGNPNTGRYFQAAENGDVYTPAFTVIGGRMTVYQLDVIDTLNIRNGAITQMATATGSGSASCNLYIPAGQIMRIVAFASSAEQYANVGVFPNRVSLLIDGVMVNEIHAAVLATDIASGDGSSTYVYSTSGITVMGANSPYGGGGRYVVMTALCPFFVSLVAFGSLR